MPTSEAMLTRNRAKATTHFTMTQAGEHADILDFLEDRRLIRGNWEENNDHYTTARASAMRPDNRTAARAMKTGTGVVLADGTSSA